MKSLSTAFIVTILLIFAVGFFAVAFLSGGTTPPPSRRANIGQAVTYTAPSAGVSTVSRVWLRYPTRGTTHFAQLWSSHRSCGQPVSREHRHGMTWTQRFQHCTMRDVVTVMKPTPRPSPSPVPTSPSYPTPAPQPQPTRVIPPSDPVAYELYLMNTTRASYGLPPYTLNQTESDGTGSCVGSHGHSEHMAQTGNLAHDQFPADICVPFSAAGENIGESGGPIQEALQTIHQEMMSEPHAAAYCASGSNHACSIISQTYTSVGIGVVTVGGTTWLCVDFIG